MKITRYKIATQKEKLGLTVAVCSDLHSHSADKAIETLRKVVPDVILLAGDIVEVSNSYMSERNRDSLEFFKNAVKIAPCFYCFGNHEIYYSHTKLEINRVPDPKMLDKFIKDITNIGIHLINDRFEKFYTPKGKSCLIGGLVCGRDMDPNLNMPYPNLEFLNEYDRQKGFKILICHYPHYYEKYLKNTSFDLIVSGHAHGGQWRIFGRGIYAPHQGLFPKYTSGIYDGRFIISRGAVNGFKIIPRFFNPTEILKINI